MTPYKSSSPPSVTRSVFIVFPPLSVSDCEIHIRSQSMCAIYLHIEHVLQTSSPDGVFLESVQYYMSILFKPRCKIGMYVTGSCLFTSVLKTVGIKGPISKHNISKLEYNNFLNLMC